MLFFRNCEFYYFIRIICCSCAVSCGV